MTEDIPEHRKRIQEERMMLGAKIAALELSCPHEVYEIEREDQVYDWRSETWYNCFCHDCYKQWTVFENSKDFKEVAKEFELRASLDN